jgi:hypothetical protein
VLFGLDAILGNGFYPAFKKVVEAGSQMIMSSYQATTSKFLLQVTLQTQRGFHSLVPTNFSNVRS